MLVSAAVRQAVDIPECCLYCGDRLTGAVVLAATRGPDYLHAHCAVALARSLLRGARAAWQAAEWAEWAE